MDPTQLDAIGRLRALVDADPANADAVLALGCALRDVEDYATAATYAQRAAALRDRFGDAAKLAAHCLHLAGQVEEAWPWYERARAWGAGDPVLNYNAGVAADALLRYDESIRCYGDALAVRPEYAEALNNLGIALAHTGRHEAAADVLRALLERRDAPARHLAHCNLGLVYHYLGRLDEAIESFRAAIALEPAFSVAYCNLGNVYYARGRADRAAAMYRRAIDLDPDNVKAYSALGSLTESGVTVPDAVVEEYEDYLDCHPWSALVYYHLGLALAERGRVEAAGQQFDKALRMEPRFREAQQAKAALARGALPSEDD